MNKADFIKELEKRLKIMPKADRDDAITYFSEYIDDMEENGEADICTLIGSPKEVAKDILADYAGKKIGEQKESKSMTDAGKVAVLIVLLIFSSPILLPLGITIFAVLFSLFAVGIGSLIVGAVSLPLAIFAPGFSEKLLSLGVSLTFLGAGALLTIAAIYLSKWSALFIVKIIKKMTKKER